MQVNSGTYRFCIICSVLDGDCVGLSYMLAAHQHFLCLLSEDPFSPSKKQLVGISAIQEVAKRATLLCSWVCQHPGSLLAGHEGGSSALPSQGQCCCHSIATLHKCVATAPKQDALVHQQSSDPTPHPYHILTQGLFMC